MVEKVLIMGAAGRDFHNFNVYFSGNKGFDVVGFTATQIPGIDDKRYPAALAGDLYPQGIPIHPESQLTDLIKQQGVNKVIFSYSDVPYTYIDGKRKQVEAAGAEFALLRPDLTMIQSSKPVISVTAVRTGCGKSQTSRKIVDILQNSGYRVAAIRHPMPYGDLVEQRVQRFASHEDMVRHKCTIEEMEEYGPYLERGMVVFAGVDYGDILNAAEKEADIILWDGGNNDFPFYKTDLWITVMDPLRPGHELLYYPGDICFKEAGVLVINKMDSAKAADVQIVKNNIAQYNPSAIVIEADSPVKVDDQSLVAGKRVLVVEDGPTLTHGGMQYGAGWVAADDFDASEIIDVRPFAVGSIAETYDKYPHMKKILPAMGYSPEQIKDLEATINAADCDSVVIGTPIDLGKLITINKPSTRVTYDLMETSKPDLNDVLQEFLQTIK